VVVVAAGARARGRRRRRTLPARAPPVRRESVIAASILAGAVLGALLCSYLSERFGRKRTIVLVAMTFALGAIAGAISPDPTTLSLSRVLLGFAVGGGTQVIPMYVAELAPPAHRGRLVLMFQVAIGVGIVIATIVGASEMVDWRVAIGAAAVPAVMMLRASSASWPSPPAACSSWAG
jgi:MFS family permease